MINKSGKPVSDSVLSREIYAEICKIEEKYSLSDPQLVKIIKARPPNPDRIPISIFSEHELSSLEAITKYLREDCALIFKEIGIVLNRSTYTASTSYQVSLHKFKNRLTINRSYLDIPTKIIANRKYSVLESIVQFLKDNHDLRFSEIARLLRLDQRTVWTVYHRAKKKK